MSTNTQTISVRVTQKEKEFLKEVSSFLGIDISEAIKHYSFEELEDIYDTNAADEAYKEYLETDKETYSFNQVKEMLRHDK